MPRRAQKTPAPAVPNRHVRLLSHTARMREVLEGDPQHVRKAEYDQQIAAYRVEWSRLTPAEKKAAITHGSVNLHDQDAKSMKAAAAALEG